MLSMLEQFRYVNALPPVADAFDSTVYPAGVNCAAAGRVLFIVQKGVGTTGTSTLTVLAADDASHTNSTAVTFWYRVIASNNTTIGAVTAATTAGFATTAGSSDMYLIEVDTDALAASGYKYCFLKAVEVANSPVLLGVIAVLGQLRFADHTANIVA